MCAKILKQTTIKQDLGFSMLDRVVGLLVGYPFSFLSQFILLLFLFLSFSSFIISHLSTHMLLLVELSNKTGFHGPKKKKNTIIQYLLAILLTTFLIQIVLLLVLARQVVKMYLKSLPMSIRQVVKNVVNKCGSNNNIRMMKLNFFRNLMLPIYFQKQLSLVGWKAQSVAHIVVWKKRTRPCCWTLQLSQYKPRKE